MVKRVILGDAAANFLFNIIQNHKLNIISKAIIITATCIIVFGLISLLLIVGIISLVKHNSTYEILMGICCVVYSLCFIMTFLIRTRQLINSKE